MGPYVAKGAASGQLLNKSPVERESFIGGIVGQIGADKLSGFAQVSLVQRILDGADGRHFFGG